MEQGAGTTDTTTDTPEMDYKDGFRYNTLEPSATSEDQTLWGLEMEFDKEKGQRTYTDFGFSNTGNFGKPSLLEPGNISANEAGDNLSAKDGFKDPNYKANSEIIIDGRGQIKNLNLYADEEDLKYINHKDNKDIVIAWKGHYTQDNPNGLKATKGDSSAINFTVNPWPNENDKLNLIKLNGSHDKKEFVQGQTIETGVKVENLDESARERLVGQVYNPITGKVVPGARAYINDEGKVVVDMPEGAVNADGTINKNSIFYNNPEYEGIQNLEVKFFARPRTRKEFEDIINNDENNFGTYTETGAGTEIIKHKGKDVEIDKQGIDRYDHYNLIGGFKLNLDDTRYYDQGFVNKKNNRTENHTFNDVEAGKGYEIKGIDEVLKDKVDIKGNYPKTSEEMKEAVKNGQASAEIDQEFITSQNNKLNPKDRWSVESTEDGDPSNFTITPPKTAKPGDHFSFPVKYTYTNGSTDIHWFHFVVQETENPDDDVPSYNARAGFEGTKLSSSPKFEESEEGKAKPTDYILEETTFTDEKGNTWTVAIDEDGSVTTTVPEGNIDGGESIEVPVKVEYTDDKGQKKYEYKTVQFFAIPNEDQPEYKQEVTNVVTSDIPYKTNVVYDDTLEAGTVVETPGTPGKLTTTFKQVVINGKKGIINENGEFIEGEEEVESKVTQKAVDGEVRVGTKKNDVQLPPDKKIEIPFDTEYELDFTKKKGEAPIQTVDGEKGEVTVKVTRNSDTGEITITHEETKAPKNRKIIIPAGTEGTHEHVEKIPFGYKVIYDENLNAGEYVIDKPGKEGTKTTTWTIENSEIKGEPKESIVDSEDAIIRVGKKPNDNMCSIPDLTPDPDQPDKPVTPEEPDKPVTPDTPDPEKPENPEEPGTPEKPETPEIPETPKIPEIPDNPEKPGTPDKPENPEEPETSEKPNEPSDKETPETPGSSKENLKEDKEEIGRVKQSKDKSKNPKTGIESIAPIFTSMGISIAGLMATKKKKKEDE